MSEWIKVTAKTLPPPYREGCNFSAQVLVAYTYSMGRGRKRRWMITVSECHFFPKKFGGPVWKGCRPAYWMPFPDPPTS